MSLTHWVEWDRELIDALFDKPALNVKGELKVEPLTKNYGTVGSAFDYALRLYVARLNANIVKDFPLVAEYGIKGNKKRKAFIEEFLKKTAAFLNGQLTLGDLLPDCIILAKIEAIYRSGQDIPNSEIFSINELDVTDIEKMLEIIDPAQWKAKKQCLLNPNFGQSSKDINGADADFIIDGSLIDIKTTKEFKFRREYFRQLAGYHLLNIRENNMHGKFKSLGIYYARFGVLFTFPVSEMKAIGVEEKLTSMWESIEESIREYQNLF
jgi:hypothetical protein